MPAAQVLVTFVRLTPAASILNPPPLFASARIIFDVDSLVVTAQSPNGASATMTIRGFRAFVTLQLTMAGIAQGRAYMAPMAGRGTGLAQQFNPRQAGFYVATGADPTLRGPKARMFIPLVTLGMPTTFAAGSGWVSPPIDACGFTEVCFATTSSAAAVLQLNRYVDPGCTASLSTGSTSPLTAATPGSISVTDSLPWTGLTIGFTNTSVSTATLTSSVLLLMAG